MSALVHEPSDDADWRAMATFADDLADLARPIARAYFRGTFDTTLKDDGSPVTAADKAIERALRVRVHECHPGHGIYGEEFGAEVRPRTWVIDPIDGTKSFVIGMPLFGTLIAFVEKGRPLVGVIDMPALSERWRGTPEGTFHDDVPARVSACGRLDQARLQTTSPDAFGEEGSRAFERLSRAVSLRRFGGDCYAYGLLASGYCDLVVEEGLKPFDFMALVPVVEGAGGIITDWDGKPLGFASAGRVVAAATSTLHAEALALLARV